MRVPTEFEEQVALVQYLNLMGIKHTSIPNSTFTTSWRQKMKNKKMGLNKGFPDLIVYLSPEQTKHGQACMLCIELKRTKGGVVSPEQRDWVNALNNVPGIESRVCAGFLEAQKFILTYLN